MPKRRGNCYVTCEALYHLMGGKRAGLVAYTVKHEGDTHWFLVLYPNWVWKSYKHKSVFLGDVIDPTFKQFKTKPNYYAGRARGFLTKKPSKRAREMMERMLWQ